MKERTIETCELDVLKLKRRIYTQDRWLAYRAHRLEQKERANQRLLEEVDFLREDRDEFKQNYYKLLNYINLLRDVIPVDKSTNKCE